VPGPRTGGLLAVIPLIFTSSTVVPVATFPGWLHAFAKVSPITVAAGALRLLSLGDPAAGHLWQALGMVTAVLTVTMPAGPCYRLTTAT
jgi:ABC-type multidrug transport system permease subunit